MKKNVLFKNMRRVLSLCMIFLVAGLVSCNNALDTGTEQPWKIGNPLDSLEMTDSVRICITGTIVEVIIDNQNLDGYNPQTLKDIEDYVFIGGLEFSEEDEKKYGFIETILVLKKDFPLKEYRFGNVISFRIVKVQSTYPKYYIGYDKCTAYICEIELLKDFL